MTARKEEPMRLEQARQIANNIKKILTPYCDRIEIAGSIRKIGRAHV